MAKKRKPKAKKDPVVSLVLALVFGAIGLLGIGHFYNEEWERGFMFLLGYWMYWFFGLIFIFLTEGFGILLILPGGLAIYAWSVIDAYHRATACTCCPR